MSAVLWALSLASWGLAGFPPIPGAEPGSGTGGPVARLLFVLVFQAIAVLGALIVGRDPRNPIGWICCAVPMLQVAPTLESDLAVYLLGRQAGTPARALGWLASWSVFAGTALVVPVLLLLPNGRLPSRRWRLGVWFGLVCVVLAAVSYAFMPGPLRALPAADNPFAIPDAGPPLAQLRLAAMVLLPSSILIAASSLVFRLRHARGDERQQLKWIAYGAVIWAIAYAATATRVWAAAMQVVYLVALGGFVAALGLAILKYRLYDIDLVINRTFLYGALAACITGVYVTVVAGIGGLVGTRGESNIALSLLAAGLVAVAFQPLRERLQRLANRVAYGRRATPYEVLAEFSRRMAGALSVDDVLPRLAEAAAHGVGGARSRVRVYVPGGLDQAAAWPTNSIGDSFEQTVPVVHQAQLVGEIAVSKPAGEPLTAIEQVLLTDLAAQAGPALANVRLAADLRAQAEELRASRQRIVSAQDAERRRIERDLHDGAQQHLVAMAVNLQLVGEIIRHDPAEAEAVLAGVRAEVNEALQTLRDLARGIYPPALAEHGILAALEAHVARMRPMPRVEPDPAVLGQRYASDVEAAVFFCVLEALQNCAKHAPGSAVSVRLFSGERGLAFCVADDGPGFDPDPATRLGAGGLRGMADRLAAVGGSLSVRSAPGQGTTIVGCLPQLSSTSST